MNILKLFGLSRFSRARKKRKAPAQGTRVVAVKKKFVAEIAPGNSFTNSDESLLRGQVRIRGGEGNTIIFAPGVKFFGVMTIVGSNNTITLGERCNLRGSVIVSGNGQTVSIGDHTTTVDVYILCHEGANVTIGQWCMFSRKIEIRTTDAHAVIDRATGKRLNSAGSITIGDHVWVGVGAIINKGAAVPADSIVGAMSFVNGRFDEEGVILAGAPARIVKRGITWARSRLPHYTPDEMNYWKASGSDGLAQQKEFAVPDDGGDF